jgi:hypothetical protein
LTWRFVPFRERPDVLVTLLVGVILILLGGLFVVFGWPYRAAVSSGIGGSLMAAAVVSGLTPFNNEAFQEFTLLGIRRSYFHRTKVPDGQWCRWLRESRLQCTLLGIAHHRWCEDGDFPDALNEALRRGARVKFLFLDPTSEVAKQRAREDERAGRNTIQEIQASIRFIWNLRQAMLPALAENLTLYVYTATPSSGTSWFDNFMVVTHYLAGFPNVTSPALLVEPAPSEPGTRSLYDIYMENLRKVEERFSGQIDDQWIQNHLPEERMRFDAL